MVSFQGKLIDGVFRVSKAPKAPTTLFNKTVQKKNTLICYCEAVYWFKDCPYINKLVQLKDWKSDKATAKKVEEKIANTLKWHKQTLKKLKKAVQSPDRSQKEKNSIFAIY